MIDFDLQGPAAGLDPTPYRDTIERLLAEEAGPDAGLTVVLAGDTLLHQLNRDHRGKDEPTDVLAFPAEPSDANDDDFPVPPDTEDADHYLGDIAVSIDAVRRNAADAGLTFDDELRHVLVHATLHLLGHTHDADTDSEAMRTREESLLGPHIHASAGHTDD